MPRRMGMANGLAVSEYVAVTDWNTFPSRRHVVRRRAGRPVLGRTGFLFLLAAAFAVASCAARQANPVSLTQPNDSQLTCEAIDAEIATNEQQAVQLTNLDGEVITNNVLSQIPVTAIFHRLDLSQKEQVEFRALFDRNEHLGRLKREKQC